MSRRQRAWTLSLIVRLPNASRMLADVLCALGLVVLIYPLAKGGVPLGLLLAWQLLIGSPQR